MLNKKRKRKEIAVEFVGFKWQGVLTTNKLCSKKERTKEINLWNCMDN